jgi:nitrile hydratase
MNGVHDMGGMHGLGPIAPEPGEPVFHERWEARTYAMALAVGAWGRWTLDAFRHQRELIPGPEYLATSYYAQWLESLAILLARSGLVSAAELKSGRPDAHAAPLQAEERVASAASPSSAFARQIADAPQFVVGDRVRARNLNPTGHTRLPRYVRGRAGEITRHHGAHVFPDSNAHGAGEDPRHLYQVRFAAKELWGEAAFGGAVYLDLWEPYLERA